jgi:hypothetical protein
MAQIGDIHAELETYMLKMLKFAAVAVLLAAPAVVHAQGGADGRVIEPLRDAR